MCRCENEKMICVDGKMERCEDEKMICVDAKMTRCEKEKHDIQTPTIIRKTLRSDALGKNHLWHRALPALS